MGGSLLLVSGFLHVMKDRSDEDFGKSGASICRLIGYDDDAWILRHPCNEKVVYIPAISGNVIIISACCSLVSH